MNIHEYQGKALFRDEPSPAQEEEPTDPPEDQRFPARQMVVASNQEVGVPASTK